MSATAGYGHSCPCLWQLDSCPEVNYPLECLRSASSAAQGRASGADAQWLFGWPIRQPPLYSMSSDIPADLDLGKLHEQMHSVLLMDMALGPEAVSDSFDPMHHVKRFRSGLLNMCGSGAGAAADSHPALNNWQCPQQRSCKQRAPVS